MTIAIRDYRPSDLNALIALFRTAVRNNAPHLYTHAQTIAWAPDDIDREEWARARSGHPTWVAVADGTIAGFTDLLADGVIDKLFVHPDFQHRGIATALLDAAESEAADRGLAMLTVEASLAARPVFERRGFAVVARQSVTLRGQTLVNFRMRKWLAL